MMHFISTMTNCNGTPCGCRSSTINIYVMETDPCPTCRQITQRQHIIECVDCAAVWLGERIHVALRFEMEELARERGATLAAVESRRVQ